MIPITGGTCAGPRLCGTVLPGGADWQLVRPDGVAEIEARYTIRVEDGALVVITNRGIRHGPEDVIRRLAIGEAVDPASYFRTVPTFGVADGPHEWLARGVFVGVGERQPDCVVVRVWQIL